MVFFNVGQKFQPEAYNSVVIFYKNYKLFIDSNLTISIVIFCLLHFISATLSLPGSCTFLNIFAGLSFGFIPAILVIYPITILSGIFNFFIGKKIGNAAFFKKYDLFFQKLKNKVLINNYYSLVLIRLSPFVPFGILNIFLGMMKMPFKLFVLTTFVGIFFDVIVLAGVGAFIAGSVSLTSSFKLMVVLSFLILFMSVYFLRIYLEKKQNILEKN